MFSGFEELLRRYAEVIVQVGLNLRRGQRLVLADPYTLQGVARAAAPIVEAVELAAREQGCTGVEVIWGDEEQWRSAARAWPTHPYFEQIEQTTRRLETAVADGAALVFLESANPVLGCGLPAAAVAAMRRYCATAYARLSPALLTGTTNWTAAPAPTPGWAAAVFPELPPAEQLPALWSVVFEACRCRTEDPVAAWVAHLAELESRRIALNARRCSTMRLQGPGTDLQIALPDTHRWCTASLSARDGRRFIPNLPTEEVFTAPHPASATGRLRVARPIVVGGAEIEGIELTFRDGLVVEARARSGGALLGRLLATDRGAMRLGEVALVGRTTAIARTGRVFHSALLDENALPHVALGDAYEFTVRGGPVNRSLIHLDLPVDAGVALA